jgi:hypothetical protein
MKTNKILTMGVIALFGAVPFLEAGKIAPLADQASPSHSSGFGGWNLSNVTVNMTDTDYNTSGYVQSFSEIDGSYPNMTYGDSFESDIHETTIGNEGTIMAKLHGKDWPVGEPAGIKVMEATSFDKVLSHSKPASCIMTTSYLEGFYLDSATPSETLCNSDFQTHKRFKLNLLPSTYVSDGNYGNGVNLTFNVASDANTWRYMVLQKINNYTDKRLDGYKMEIGFLDATTGVFTTASANAADIRLSIGTGEDTKNGVSSDIWASDELATFSHGLFGKADDHFESDGFFDDTAAGYNVLLNGTKDTIESNGMFVDSNYTAIPVPYSPDTTPADGTPDGVAGQFGNWPPSIWAPKGIFWDNDNNPATDAEIVAFWADRGDGTYAWMKGNEDGFAEATALELATWASSSVHSIDVIEDVLNLGLSYIVEIGDVATFPAAANNTFTIRITPHFASTQIEPGYVINPPSALSTYVSEKGTLSITPAPSFTVGNTLTLVVADQGLDTSINIDTVDISVTTSLGETETITLTEIGANRGVFTATLPTVLGTAAGSIGDGSVTVAEGTVVTAEYTDEYDGLGNSDVLVSSYTTALITPIVVTPVTPVTTTTDGGGGSGAVNDNISLLFTIFGFLLIGGLIVRRKLA